MWTISFWVTHIVHKAILFSGNLWQRGRESRIFVDNVDTLDTRFKSLALQSHIHKITFIE
jgi:hypothetical protein